MMDLSHAINGLLSGIIQILSIVPLYGATKATDREEEKTKLLWALVFLVAALLIRSR